MRSSRKGRLAAAFWGTALVLGAGLGVIRGADAVSEKTVWNFESETPGQSAKGFATESGRWVVASDGPNRVLAQRAKNPDDTFNLVLVAGTSYRDVDLSVRLKAEAGEVDQGGGAVWRAKDAKNYYLARYNPLEDNFRVYKVENGKRTQLRSAKVPGDLGWHTLRITMSGHRIACYLDGKKHLEAEDPTFAGEGRIGLWSKADAQSLFDDLTVSIPD